MNTTSDPIPEDPPSRSRIGRMGETFLRAGKLTAPQIESIVALQDAKGLRFGQAAIELGLLTEADIQTILASQFNYEKPTQTLQGERLSPELAIVFAPHSPEAEAIRSVRSEILLQPQVDAVLRIAVLSPSAMEGRSYTAANLAVAFSQMGKKTLLIDADLRSPSIHHYFGNANKTGLSTVLAGRSDYRLDETTQTLPSLWVLTSGPIPPNPSEILRPPHLNNFLLSLESLIDVLIVDTPATGNSSDARLISSQVGGVLIVGRSNVSTQQSIKNLLADLKTTDIRILGCIYNQYSEIPPPLHLLWFMKPFIKKLTHTRKNKN